MKTNTLNSFEGLKEVLTNGKNGSIPSNIQRREELKAAKSVSDLDVQFLRPDTRPSIPFRNGNNGGTIFYKWVLYYTKGKGWGWKQTKETPVTFPEGKAPDKFLPGAVKEGEVVGYATHAQRLGRSDKYVIKTLRKRGVLLQNPPIPNTSRDFEWQIKHGGNFPDLDKYQRIRKEIEAGKNESTQLISDLKFFRSLKNWVYEVVNTHSHRRLTNTLTSGYGEIIQDHSPRIPIKFFQDYFEIPEELDLKNRFSWYIPDKTVFEEEELTNAVDSKHTTGDDYSYEDEIPGYDCFFDEWGVDYQMAHYKLEFVKEIVNTSQFWSYILEMKSDIHQVLADIAELTKQCDEIVSHWTIVPVPVFGQDDWISANYNGMVNDYSVKDLPMWDNSDPNAMVFHPGWNARGNRWDTDDYLDPNSECLSNNFYYRQTHNIDGFPGREEFLQWKEDCQTFSVIITSSGKAYKYPPIDELVKVCDKTGKSVPVTLRDVPNPLYENGTYILPKRTFITKVLGCGYELDEGRKGAAVISPMKY